MPENESLLFAFVSVSNVAAKVCLKQNTLLQLHKTKNPQFNQEAKSSEHICFETEARYAASKGRSFCGSPGGFPGPHTVFSFYNRPYDEEFGAEAGARRAPGAGIPLLPEPCLPSFRPQSRTHVLGRKAERPRARTL